MIAYDLAKYSSVPHLCENGATISPPKTGLESVNNSVTHCLILLNIGRLMHRPNGSQEAAQVRILFQSNPRWRKLKMVTSQQRGLSNFY